MKILGFNISIPLFLMINQAKSLVPSNEFPKDGTFSDQVDFVEGLPRGCGARSSAQITALLSSDNPFELMTKMPEGMKASVYRHEFDQKDGIVYRRTKTSGHNVVDTTQSSDTQSIVIGGVGDRKEEITITLVQNKDGTFKVKSKDTISIDVHAKRLEQQPIGLAVEVEYNGDECVSTNAPRMR